MVFVDGTNFLCQAAIALGIEFRAEKPPWPAIAFAHAVIAPAMGNIFDATCIRKYWVASYKGEETYEQQYCKELRKSNFEPVLFRKVGKREKGVDIALTMEMLVNAFQQNYDHGLLVAGDEDYRELVQEVKRYGPIVDGAFFDTGMSPRLRLAFDTFRPFGNLQGKSWDNHRERIRDWQPEK